MNGAIFRAWTEQMLAPALQPGDIVIMDTIVLAGGCAVIPGVDEAVSGRTQINAVIANPFANMALSQRIRPKQLATDAPSLLVACGLAMRRFDQ